MNTVHGVSRKEIAKEFRDAIPRIALTVEDFAAYPKYRFICLALKSGATDYSRSEANKLAEKIIVDRMGDAAVTLENWLEERGYLDLTLVCPLYPEVQEYRVRWLQALAEEFSQPA